MCCSRLTITGTAGSDVKVNCSVPVFVMPFSVTESVTEKLPSVVAVPEIAPVTGSMLRPGGRPVALISRCRGAPARDHLEIERTPSPTGCCLVTLMITGPEAGSGWTVRTSVASVVPAAFEAPGLPEMFHSLLDCRRWREA